MSLIRAGALRRFPLLAAMALLLPSAAQAANYYVSPSGSDGNPGSQAAPFREIRRALQSVTAGDTVFVADGQYLGFDVRNKHGRSGAPITIKALGAAAAVVPTTDRVDNRDTIFVTFSSYVVVDGLRSFNANRAAVRVDQSPSITIRNGVFGNNARWGIFTDFSDDLLLEFNECYGSVAEHGIYVSNSGDRPVVRGNICRDNYASGIQLNADLSAGGDGLISEALLENNVCFNNGRGGAAALNLDGVQDSLVRNNLLFNNHATGIVNYQGDGAEGPRGMVIVHNTVDQPSDGRWCLNLLSTTGLNVLRNNILYTRHSFRGSIEYGSAADVANTDSDYNVLSKVAPDYGGTVLTLAQWQAQGKEPHSLTATAADLWVSATGTDYHLRTGSPAVDRGVATTSAPLDLEGRTRPQGAAPDLGCLEQPSAAPPPDTTAPAVPTGLTATAGDARVTLAWNVNNESDLAGYFVYRAAAQSGPYSRQNSAPLTKASLVHTGLTNGQTYWYAVSAVDQSGNESAAGTPVGATPQAPAPVVALSSLVFDPSTLRGGQSSTGTVSLTAPAPPGGLVMTLKSGDKKVSVPSQITVSAGSATASFTARTSRVSARRTVTVTATLNGISRSATLTLVR